MRCACIVSILWSIFTLFRTSALAAPSPATPQVKWEGHVSTNSIFTVRKPAGWQVKENFDPKAGTWSCNITDPDKRLYFIVGGTEFVTPRYYVPRVKGVLCSTMLSPHEALAYATTHAGLGSSFRSVFVKPRTDLAQTARGFSGPLRPVAVEDFAYTFNNKEGRSYTGFSCGGGSGDAMGASWRLWHFTIMAPSDQFEAALPTLAAVMGSYELNGEMAGRQMANNMANYYAGLRNVSHQIAMNSEQMRLQEINSMEMFEQVFHGAQ
jgi:hypothetical protein